MSSSIVYKGFSYGTNGQHKDAACNRCSKYASGCHARLTIRKNTITEKGSHRCESQVASHSITHPEIPVDDYINTDIYRQLLISLSEKYVYTPYKIPSKNCVDSIIRNNRGLVERNQIEADLATRDVRRFGQSFQDLHQVPAGADPGFNSVSAGSAEDADGEYDSAVFKH
ncbi:hypothetical protein RF11_14311 [Thelohanellus kitauei]|uniref:FLYWCH-type domain-containing protein n=1 Tax=Thelohanellus kitauei TaxID=669202 RepID=A0A0C2N124_THEKT|nr:hypothetical protein RF11_14311 [Thelohanellus kitauei]